MSFYVTNDGVLAGAHRNLTLSVVHHPVYAAAGRALAIASPEKLVVITSIEDIIITDDDDDDDMVDDSHAWVDKILDYENTFLVLTTDHRLMMYDSKDDALERPPFIDSRASAFDHVFVLEKGTAGILAIDSSEHHFWLYRQQHNGRWSARRMDDLPKIIKTTKSLTTLVKMDGYAKIDRHESLVVISMLNNPEAEKNPECHVIDTVTWTHTCCPESLMLQLSNDREILHLESTLDGQTMVLYRERSRPQVIQTFTICWETQQISAKYTSLRMSSNERETPKIRTYVEERGMIHSRVYLSLKGMMQTWEFSLLFDGLGDSNWKHERENHQIDYDGLTYHRMGYTTSTAFMQESYEDQSPAFLQNSNGLGRMIKQLAE